MLTWCPANDHTRFFKELPIISEITLMLMTWKAKSATTHCEYLYPARVIASPFNRWPVTQIFPGRNPCNSSWTICVLLCPQNLKNLRRTYNSLLTPDPEWSPIVHIRMICSHRIQIIHLTLIVCNGHWEKRSYRARNYLYRVWNINTGSETIGSANGSEDFIHMRLLHCQIMFINLFVADPNAEQIQMTDWFHKLKVTDLNISKRINDSPFLINNKIIKQYHI